MKKGQTTIREVKGKLARAQAAGDEKEVVELKFALDCFRAARRLRKGTAEG